MAIAFGQLCGYKHRVYFMRFERTIVLLKWARVGCVWLCNCTWEMEGYNSTLNIWKGMRTWIGCKCIFIKMGGMWWKEEKLRSFVWFEGLLMKKLMWIRRRWEVWIEELSSLGLQFAVIFVFMLILEVPRSSCMRMNSLNVFFFWRWFINLCAF